MQQVILSLFFMSCYLGFAVAAVVILQAYSESSHSRLAQFLREVL